MNGERPEPAKLVEVYKIYHQIIKASEDHRWIRLNTLLVVSSIFVLAWAAIYTSASNSNHLSAETRIILTIICLPGILCGFSWSFLGRRSSKYLDDCYDEALNLEEPLSSVGTQMPYTMMNPIRLKVKTGWRQITASKWLVTYVPLVFMFLFVALLCVSWSDILISYFHSLIHANSTSFCK